MQIFVDINASENGNGSQEFPFKYIQQAADIAQPGDYVQVMPGEYHEEVHQELLSLIIDVKTGINKEAFDILKKRCHDLEISLDNFSNN